MPFLLDDGTGPAIVDPSAAQGRARRRRPAATPARSTTPNERESRVPRSATARAARTGCFNKRLRYREAIIAVGETVAIVGEGVREPDPDAAPAAAIAATSRRAFRMTARRRSRC